MIYLRTDSPFYHYRFQVDGASYRGTTGTADEAAARSYAEAARLKVTSVPPKRRSEFLYLITADYVGRFKVGRSVDPSVRLRSHQVSSPVPLRLKATVAVPDAARAERLLLRQLRATGNHAHGEWFHFTDQTRRVLKGVFK